MNLLALIPDNITEVLTKVIRFTELREVVLHRNIEQATRSDYVPSDLPVTEFAAILNEAVAEHLRCGRLLFRDTTNVSFRPDGRMHVQPVIDEHARALLQTDPGRYFQLQGKKLRENSLNRRVSEQLLKHTGSAIAGWQEPQREAAKTTHDGAPEMSSQAHSNE